MIPLSSLLLSFLAMASATAVFKTGAGGAAEPVGEGEAPLPRRDLGGGGGGGGEGAGALSCTRLPIANRASTRRYSRLSVLAAAMTSGPGRNEQILSRIFSSRFASFGITAIAGCGLIFTPPPVCFISSWAEEEAEARLCESFNSSLKS
mmetsp:Transcript_42564/g.69895  ORF Transcript_42564/g.69895 Transcript_42564/m.69895 type:complete len:149 (+) Transcript_42564:884-1330(+)